MTDTTVSLSKDGPLGIITLDRPPANSYEIKFMRDLDDAIEGAAADDDIKTVLIVSASQKFFCGGGDIKAFRENTPAANTDLVTFAHDTLSKIGGFPKVFIAVINGHAMGGGLEIALACDLRFAGDRNYYLALPETTLGLIPGNGGTQRLPRLIGIGPALELMLSGSTVDPRQALELGLVNKLFPPESLLDEAKAYALKLARGPARANGYIKRCVYEGMEMPLADGLVLERDLISELFFTEDAQEGLAAFVEKRQAEFKGA
jgi:enoyl-CoA hydratase/carnithine racemase